MVQSPRYVFTITAEKDEDRIIALSGIAAEIRESYSPRQKRGNTKGTRIYIGALAERDALWSIMPTKGEPGEIY